MRDTLKFQYSEVVSVMKIYVIMKLYYAETHKKLQDGSFVLAKTLKTKQTYCVYFVGK